MAVDTPLCDHQYEEPHGNDDVEQPDERLTPESSTKKHLELRIARNRRRQLDDTASARTHERVVNRLLDEYNAMRKAS